MDAGAQLIADRGEAAASAEFFRSPPFMEAEGVTHTLRIDSVTGTLAVPLVVREVPGGGRHDATSPYGYPGGDGVAEVDPGAVDWSSTGLVAIFVRDRIGMPPCFDGATVRGTVQVADPGRPSGLRKTYATEIRRNRRLGYSTDRIAGPTASPEDVELFHRLYTETRERAEASRRYFFDVTHLRSLLRSDRSWLVVTRAPDSRPAAAAIAALSDGMLHYYLSGSSADFLERSPTKSALEEICSIAAELDVALNLGGGASPGDGLEDFKRGFANAEAPFHTHEIVCDPAAYRELSAGHEGGGFFPAYRAGG